jgi:hypothetical protein
MTEATATPAAKNVNYSPELTKEIVADYEAGTNADERKEIVENLSAKHGKSVRSIRQKLVREGVYIKPEYVAKTGKDVERKSDIVQSLAGIFNVTEDQLGGLEKATKPALELVRSKYLACAALVELDAGDEPEVEE